VVTGDEAADAYTLPGWPCRIVVTAGMMRALSHPERQVLLAHERAHASGLHYLFTTAARLAAAANPLLRPVAAAVGYTVERWADERAAAVAGDRRLAARAIATAARAATAAPARRAEPAAALAAVGRPCGRRGAGPVPRRVAALLSPPPQPRLLLLVVAVLLVAVAGASALEAARELHGLLDYARAAGPP
jgi:beta-lactamase regulating signal transducer with metallopeptidase domain